ncbi:OLC1v1002092C1 [Oldenlandia corymbosa var. corymbosa]|uniref:OLC1v1002092C1 n=1 Tax=Oldenlandia corymbosa var. corymbosa TaxID=529605 RepID=A0AAV1D8F4_OLDCO|nr:OLC1v1002092C1 [Oldenlandia corymbosa var. corymbosa]
MSQITEGMKANSTNAIEVYKGKSICQEKSKCFLKDLGLPSGLLPLDEIEECGFVKETGFIWLKQKRHKQHKFEKIGKFAHYATEITAYAEPKKLKQVTGIKAKELFMWITVTEVNVDDDYDDSRSSSAGKLTFKTPTGLCKVFPASAFEAAET